MMVFCAALSMMKRCGGCAHSCKIYSTRKSVPLRFVRLQLVGLRSESCHQRPNALSYGDRNTVPGPLIETEREKRRYPFSAEIGRCAWRNLLRAGTNDKRIGHPKSSYPIFVNENDVLRIPKMAWDEQNAEHRILEPPRKDETVVWPVKKQDGRKNRNKIGSVVGSEYPARRPDTVCKETTTARLGN